MDYDDDYDPHGHLHNRNDSGDSGEESDPSGAPTFFVFAMFRYYPDGGMSDLHSSHETLDEARDARDHALTSQGFDRAHIAQFTTKGLTVVE